MHPQLRKLFLLLTLCVVTACGSSATPPDPCAGFPKELAEANKVGIKLEDKQTSILIDTAVQKIQTGLPTTQYYQPGDVIVFDRAAVGSDAKIYLFFEFRNVTDAMLVYMVRKDGAIDKAFQYNQLSRFEVPD